ncbi:MAG: PPC domain-containing protein [Candidatus Eisenbacteria bacterium]
MRIANVFLILFVFGFCLGSPAWAKDTEKMEEPEWHYDLSGMVRSVVPEVEPNDECGAGSQAITCGDEVNPAQILPAGEFDWFAFQANAGDGITIGLDASDLCDPDVNDTYIYLYRDDCTTILAQDDDSGPGYYSQITNFSAPYTGTYYVKVRGYSASYEGCYKMFTTCAPLPTGACCLAGGVCEVMTQGACTTAGGTYQGNDTVCEPNPCPQPPPNDLCSGAIELPRCQNGLISATTIAAANDYNPGDPGPSCTGYNENAKDVTYYMNLLAGDTVHLVYTTPAYDGAIYIVTDCENESATCVVGEDDPEPETIDWTATADGTYFVIADGFSTNGGGDFTLEWSITCPPPAQACCFVDGSCQMLTAEVCLEMSGTPQGEGSVCEPNPCEIPPTACCFPDGTCQMLPREECLNQGGQPLNDVCDPNPCDQPPMACCFPDGSCQFTLEAYCIEAGGAPQGYGTNCEPNLCEQPPVACCFPDGTCEFVTADICVQMGGAPGAYGTDCEPNDCPQPPVACCFADGSCEFVLADVCTQMGGTPGPYGTDCEPNDCPQPPAEGACCFTGQLCEVMSSEDCIAEGGTYQGDDVSCDPNPCPPTATKDATWGRIKANYR